MALNSGIENDGLTPPRLNTPDLITSPYHQTTFMGATVTDFSGKLGFGTQSSDISIQLVEDSCAGSVRRSYSSGSEVFSGEGQDKEGEADNFIMPPVGTPKVFKYGTFQYGGLIKNVERSTSISKKGYTVRMESPSVVLKNAQIVLKGLDDSFTSSPNIINLHQDLGGRSWCNDVGVTWSNILSVIEGHRFYHRGFDYTLLVAGSVPGNDLRFSGDNIDVMAAIEKAAKSQGIRIFVELIGINVIKIYSDSGDGASTSSRSAAPGAFDVDEGEIPAQQKLVKGSVYRAINKSSLGFGDTLDEEDCATTGNLISLNYGVEAGEACTHAMVNGAFQSMLFQVTNGDTFELPGNDEDEEDGGGDDEGVGNPGDFFDDDDETTELIRQHFGNDPTTGDIICAEPFEDDDFPVTPFGLGFTVDVTIQPFYDSLGEDTYHITELEIRAAEESFEIWYEYMCIFKKKELKAILGAAGVPAINWEMIVDNLQQGRKALTAAEINQAAIDAMQAKEAREKKSGDLHNLHEFVSSFGQFYGKKYAVLLPRAILCCPSATDPPNVLKNYEQTDGGWPDDETEKILLLDFRGVGIELFKTEEGKVGCFVRYKESDVPEGLEVDVTRLETVWWKEKEYYYIKASVDEVVQYPCDNEKEKGKLCTEDNEGGAPFLHAAIIDVSGGLRVTQPTNVAGGPVRGLAQALAPIILEGIMKEELEDDDFLDLEDVLMHRWGGHTLKNIALSAEPVKPDAANVPLESRELCYGPWVDDDSDHGSAEYEKDENLAPWNFNGYKLMNLAGAAQTELKTSGKTILESGSSKYTGLPNDAGVPGLGSPLGGATCTSVSFNLGVGGVTTSLTFRTFVPNFGSLAQSRLEFMETMAKAQQKFQRAFNTKAAERRQRSLLRSAILAGGGGEGGKVADKQANAHGGKEFGPRYMGGTSIGALGAFTSDFVEDPNRKADYPDHGKYTTVVAEGIRQMTEEADLAGDSWKKSAGVGLEGLFRPYQITKQNADFTVYELGEGGSCEICPSSPTFNAGLSTLFSPCCSPSTSTEGCAIEISSKSTNPFMTSSEAKNYASIKETFLPGNDTRTLVYGQTPPSDGLKPLGEEPTDIRPLGVKGPVVIVGWGYDTQGSPVPAEPNDPCKFADDWLVRPDTWKAGPLDVRWDDCKKMWVPPPVEQKDRNIIVYAKLKGTLDPGGTQKATPVGDGSDSQPDFVVTNRLGQPLCKDQHIFAYFNPDGCEWVVMQAEFMPICVVTDINAYETEASGSGSPSPNCLDLAATTRIIYTQTPPTIGVETRWAQVSTCGGSTSGSPSDDTDTGGGTGTPIIGRADPCDNSTFDWTTIPGYNKNKAQVLGHDANQSGTCTVKWMDIANC